MIIEVIKGDLLNCKESIMCQQCNCLTMKSHGLSEQVSKKYPWADVYGRRKIKTRNCTSEPSFPGTIQIDTDPNSENNFKIVHMFGQILPGKPNSFMKSYQSVIDNTKFLKDLKDGPIERVEYFKKCLESLDSLELKEPVAMPYQIGCGLAGGSWEIYKKMLNDCKTNIILYKL